MTWSSWSAPRGRGPGIHGVRGCLGRPTGPGTWISSQISAPARPPRPACSPLRPQGWWRGELQPLNTSAVRVRVQGCPEEEEGAPSLPSVSHSSTDCGGGGGGGPDCDSHSGPRRDEHQARPQPRAPGRRRPRRCAPGDPAGHRPPRGGRSGGSGPRALSSARRTRGPPERGPRPERRARRSPAAKAAPGNSRAGAGPQEVRRRTSRRTAEGGQEGRRRRGGFVAPRPLRDGPPPAGPGRGGEGPPRALRGPAPGLSRSRGEREREADRRPPRGRPPQGGTSPTRLGRRGAPGSGCWGCRRAGWRGWRTAWRRGAWC